MRRGIRASSSRRSHPVARTRKADRKQHAALSVREREVRKTTARLARLDRAQRHQRRLCESVDRSARSAFDFRISTARALCDHTPYDVYDRDIVNKYERQVVTLERRVYELDAFIR